MITLSSIHAYVALTLQTFSAAATAVAQSCVENFHVCSYKNPRLESFFSRFFAASNTAIITVYANWSLNVVCISFAGLLVDMPS